MFSCFKLNVYSPQYAKNRHAVFPTFSCSTISKVLSVTIIILLVQLVPVANARTSVVQSKRLSNDRTLEHSQLLSRLRRDVFEQPESISEGDTTPDFSVKTNRVPSPTNRFYILRNSVSERIEFPFVVGEVSGRVALKEGHFLDYDGSEAGRLIEFSVLVNSTDGEDSDTVHIRVEVTPSNDERPVFTMEPAPYYTTIPQGRSIAARTPVYRLTASDRDHDSRLRFNLAADPSGLFIVHPDTGVITTVTDLLYSQPSYPLTVQAYGSGSLSGTDVTTATLTIAVGTLAPQFYEESYSTTVAEHVNVNSVIFPSIRVHSYQSERISFSIVERELRPVFALQELPRDSSGSEAVSLVLLTPLDYEKGQTDIRLTVKALEAGTQLASEVQVDIKVIDLNDYQPSFLLSEIFPQTPFAESTPNGTVILTVTALDGDTGENGRLTYTVQSENQEEVPPFIVESVDNKGIIRTSGSLDYEFEGVATRGYHLLVTATDNGTPPKSGSVTVRVRVTNENDEPPRFVPSSLNVEVERTHPVNNVIAPLSAYDPDGSTGITYRIVDRDGGPFFIDSETGVVRLSQTLDSARSRYTLNVSAMDDGSCCTGDTPRNTGYTTITVQVVGVNQPPVFPCSSYTDVSVNEESPRDKFVHQFVAIDTDVGRNGQLSYFLERTGGLTSSTAFYMEESTGRLYVSRGIDREETPEIYVTIKATDGGVYPLSGYCTLLIRLTDVNDNQPEFSRPPEDIIVQAGTAANYTLYRFFATDRDLEKNSAITFSVVENQGDLFFISGRNLLCKSILSSIVSYDLKVRAADGGTNPLYTDIAVRVTVREQDDAPYFNNDENGFTYSVYENTPENTIIARLKASARQNQGRVSYFVVETGAFSADKEDTECQTNNQLCLAIYSTAAIDYEKLDQRQYEVRVRATVDSATGLSSAAASREQTVIVKVLDVNDNVPRFQLRDSNGFVRGSVRENQDVNGKIVLTLTAEDEDTVEAYRTVTFSLAEGERDYEFFEIDPAGVVRVRASPPTWQFDREAKSFYTIEAIAEDGADSARTGVSGPNRERVIVRIDVIDDNDNTPRFEQDVYEASVRETVAPGEVVIRTTVRDLDIDNRFTYRIISGNSPQAFRAEDSGNIVVNSALDYDLGQQSYDMVLLVSDGRYENTTRLLVNVINENDNVPRFGQQYYTDVTPVEEERPYAYLLLVKVSATDADQRPQTNITYSLDGANAALFTINSMTGEVYLSGTLDRDRPNGRPQWDVNVLATDEPGSLGAQIGYAVVRVEPIDINDNVPLFVEPLHGWIAEESPAGTKVMTLRSVDYDAGTNAEVTYSLVSGSVRGYFTVAGEGMFDGSDNLFSIEGGSGIVTLGEGGIDREVVSRYEMRVRARDGGSPSKSAETLITVYVSDINDNPPTFDKDCWTISVSEAAKSDDVIFSGVTASDPDINDTLSYVLTDTVSLSRFKIRTSPTQYRAAELLLHSELDYEKFVADGQSTTFRVEMMVNDGGAGSDHSASACLLVTLLDANDETPRFVPNALIERTVSEETPGGTKVANFNATDDDVRAEDRAILYFIDQTSDPQRNFDVNTETGEVYLRRALDRESPGQPQYTVTIEAVDQGYPPLTGKANLVVTVEDVNDNAPSFITPVVYLSEGAPAESTTDPQLLLAEDPDSDTAGPPFSMELASPSDLFNFTFIQTADDGNGAGRLISIRPLDRELDGPEVKVSVKLSDREGVNAVRDITVILKDLDDNPPKASTSFSHVFNYEAWHALGGDFTTVPVGDCYAEDPDDWDKPNKDYSEVGDWPEAFSIVNDTNSSSNGLIRVDLALLPSPEGEFSLQCSVTDHYRPTGAVEKSVATVISTVTVRVQKIDDGPVRNAGTMRLAGLTAEQFLTATSGGSSPIQSFRSFQAKHIGIPPGNVDIFTVRDVPDSSPPQIDILFSAHGSPYYNSSKLLYGALTNRAEFESSVGVTISQSPVNPCASSGEICTGGCTPRLVIADTPLFVNANGSVLVGVDASVEAVCGCSAELRSSERLVCGPGVCLNGGVCSASSPFDDSTEGFVCTCPRGFDGPRCQQTSHHFNGNGWAWYPTLSQCEAGTTTLELATSESESLLLYNGPHSDPGSGPEAVNDFMAIGVIGGYPHLFIDLGSGMVDASVGTKVNDGEWHRLNIRRNGRDILFTVDECRSASSGDRSGCEVRLMAPGSTRQVNVGTPLELGGTASAYTPSGLSTTEGFRGCLRNLVHNGEIYDFHIGNVGKHKNTADGCTAVDVSCGSGICGGSNSLCDSNLWGDVTCSCKPMYRGDRCYQDTEVVDFLGGDARLEWSFKSNLTPSLSGYTTDIQLSFRSRDSDGNGLLFGVSDRNTGKYLRLQLREGVLEVVYDIGIINTADALREQSVRLVDVTLTNGLWHTARVSRVGRSVTLAVDGGEGRFIAREENRLSEEFFLVGGGKNASVVESGGMDGRIGSIVISDLSETCLTDVRVSGHWLPLTTEENEFSVVAQLVAISGNVSNKCASEACGIGAVTCVAPLVCYDLWKKAVCRCPVGYEATPGGSCGDIDECAITFPLPCTGQGSCENMVGGYTCACNSNWSGRTCAVRVASVVSNVVDMQAIAISVGILAAILVVAILAVCVILYYRRNRDLSKSGDMDGDYDRYYTDVGGLRENVVDYAEEGAPEEDQDGYDLGYLQQKVANPRSKSGPPGAMGNGKPNGHLPPERNYADMPLYNLSSADFRGSPALAVPPPPESFSDRSDPAPLVYGEESTPGSRAGTFSDLLSANSDADQDYSYLRGYGPKFNKLSELYRQGEEDGY